MVLLGTVGVVGQGGAWPTVAQAVRAAVATVGEEGVLVAVSIEVVGVQMSLDY